MQTKLTVDEVNNLASFDLFIEITMNEFTVFGVRFIQDSNVRLKYQSLIKSCAAELRMEAIKTQNYKLVAKKAVQLRNAAMNQMRTLSTDLGSTYAFKLKNKGKLFDELLDISSKNLHGKPFSQVKDIASQRRVFFEVIEASGRSRTSVSKTISVLGKAGKGLVVASIGIAIYEVATAQDPKQEAVKQSSSLALGSAFSIAGGWAGGFCGPAAFACVPLGVFIGGALGSVAAELIY